MTDSLQVGQFAIVDGEPVDRGPNAGIFLGRGPADDRAELFLVAEGTSPAGESFAGHVVSAAGNLWKSLDMSVTGALTRVFAEAERSLDDWNQKSIVQHRVALGMTCFAHRAGQALLAQAGPSVAFLLHGDEVEIYSPDEAHGRPLGTGASVEPQIQRIPFGPGDRLLILSTPALRALDDELIAGILALPEASILPDLYRRLGGVSHETVLLVTCPSGDGALALDSAGDEEDEGGSDEPIIGLDLAAPAPARATPHSGHDHDRDAVDDAFQPALFIAGGAPAPGQARPVHAAGRLLSSVPAIDASVPAPLRRVSGDDLLARLADEHRTRASVAGALAGSGRPLAAGHAGTSGVERRHQSFARGLVREQPRSRPAPPPAVDAPLVTELADGVRASLGGGQPPATSATSRPAYAGAPLVRVRSTMGGGRWKGGGGLDARARSTTFQLPSTWVVILVGLALLVALVAFVTLPRLGDGDTDAEYTALLDTAGKSLSRAQALQQDPAQRRALLVDAQAALLEARDLPVAGPEVTRMLDQVTALLTDMDAIRTPALEVAASLEAFGDRSIVASRLVVGADTAYLLDSASNTVVAAPLVGTAKPTTLYSEDKAAARGRPVAIAWLPARPTGAAGLLIADSDRRLWLASAGSLRQVAFSAPQNLTVTDIAAAGAELFVLDAPAARVFRFSEAEGGFANPPVTQLTSPDLTTARRLNVERGIQRELFVTTDTGALRLFAGQLTVELSLAGIDRPVAAPDAPHALPGGALLVADPANDRLVELGANGAFIAQYRHASLEGLEALSLDDGSIYVFSRQRIWRVTLQPR